MRIAVFISNNPTSGWNMGYGIINTLRRMGPHDRLGLLGNKVLCVPMPTEVEMPTEQLNNFRRQLPSLDFIKKNMDAIIVSGPEHIGPWIAQCYGIDNWKQVDIPKAVWLHESTVREDYRIEFDDIKWLGDQFFFPAIQDADWHDQEVFAKDRSHFLPFGVDTQIFKPQAASSPLIKNFDVGFIGMMYPKRASFLMALRKHKIPPIRHGNCNIQSLHGYDWEGSMRLLASNTREVKVFFNLPAMSRLLVAKVFETMACGTFLMTPELPDDRGAQKNMELFKHGEHLAYYSPSHLGMVAQMLREWISPEKDAEREKIAAAGCALVHKYHSLEVRLTELLAKLKVGVLPVNV